jgi:hypothetical protein
MSEDWRDDALCKDKHKDIWFPPFSDERPYPEKDYYNIAKMVCAVCPVRTACSHEGKVEEYGVWGGRTPKERTGLERNWESPYVMDARYIDKVPVHVADERLSIPDTMNVLRKYFSKRPHRS